MNLDKKCSNCYYNKDNPKVCLPVFCFLECRYQRVSKKRKMQDK